MITANLAKVRECVEASHAWHHNKSDGEALDKMWETLNEAFPATGELNCVNGFVSALCDQTDLSSEAVFILTRLIVEGDDDARD